MFLVEVHSPNATRSRSRGVFSLNTAAMSSSTISGSLLSIRMGTGPIFAQALVAVNPLLGDFNLGQRTMQASGPEAHIPGG